MPKFKPGDRVRFEGKELHEFMNVGDGTVIDNRLLDDEGIWLQINWDDDSWSTEKPEWLEAV